MKNTALFIDSACDLPPDFIRKHSLEVIPINIRLDEKVIHDKRNPELSNRFFHAYSERRTADLETFPSSVDRIRNLIIQRAAYDYENLLIMCISSTRSKIFENALQAKLMVPEVVRLSERGREVKLKNIEVIDTHTIFSGQAVVAYYATAILKGKPDIALPDLTVAVQAVSDSVHTYFIVNDLFYVKHRGKLRGETNVGTLAYVLGKSFGVKPIVEMHKGVSKTIGKYRGFDNALSQLYLITRQAIQAGLKTPVVMVSYSGPLEEISEAPGYRDLAGFAKNFGVRVYLSVMSISAGIYTGPGAISLSVAHE